MYICPLVELFSNLRGMGLNRPSDPRPSMPVQLSIIFSAEPPSDEVILLGRFKKNPSFSAVRPTRLGVGGGFPAGKGIETLSGMYERLSFVLSR
jgi:hypothetical protein